MDEVPHMRLVTVVMSGPSIADVIPQAELGEHELGLKCPCSPKKILRMDGPHVRGVNIAHTELSRLP